MIDPRWLQKMKRLCPYVGPNIPDRARQNAKEFWPPPLDPDEYAGWQWDAGSGHYQAELELCDLTATTIDPSGYAAIRPLGPNKFVLIFVGCFGSPGEDLTFLTMQEAKRYLDTLLAAKSPEIPPAPGMLEIT